MGVYTIANGAKNEIATNWNRGQTQGEKKHIESEKNALAMLD